MPTSAKLTYSKQILNFLLRTFSNDLSLLSDGAPQAIRIADTPVPIMDIKGKPLFLHFDIVDANGVKLGAVRASGRGDELPPIDAIVIGEGALNPAAARARVEQILARDYGGYQATELGFACYSYPRIGMIHTIVDGAGKKSVLLHDAFTGQLVKSSPGEDPGQLATEGGAGDVEGELVYDINDFLLQSGSDSIAQQQWQALRKLSQPSNRPMALDTTEVAHDPSVPAVRGIYLPIPLRAQETPVYCAVASAQMMLSYLGITKTQAEIAAVLKTGPNGTTRGNLANGLQCLIPNGLITRYDSSVTFEGVRQVLERSLPVKSGIPGHARLISGARIYDFVEPMTGKIIFTDCYYLVNDPYPPNIGHFSMENANNAFDIFEDTLCILPQS
jgi:hypothetical protein